MDLRGALMYSPLAGRCWPQVDDETVTLDVGEVGLVLRGRPTFMPPRRA